MLKVLHDGDSEKVWIDSRVIDSDHPVRLLVRLMYMEEHMSEQEMKESNTPKYHIEIHAVSPEFAGAEKCTKAALSFSLGYEAGVILSPSKSLETFKELNQEDQCRVLMDYGVSAPIFQKAGKNIKKLVAEVQKELKNINMLFGLYMDKPLNRIGNTGWDWIKGEVGFKQRQTV